MPASASRTSSPRVAKIEAGGSSASGASTLRCASSRFGRFVSSRKRHRLKICREPVKSEIVRSSATSSCHIA